MEGIMTNRQKIKKYLEDHKPKKYSNWQLAEDLSIPEASVRRATHSLFTQDMHVDSDYLAPYLFWWINK